MTYSEPKANTKNPAATLAVSILGAAILTACGGSSDGGGGTPDVNQEAVTINTTENSVATRQFDGAIDPGSVVSVSGYEIPDITTDFEGDTLTITVGELANEAQERFTVETDTGTQYTVSINAENTSAQPAIRQSKTMTEIASVATLAGDDVRILNTVLEIEYLAQDITDSQKIESQSSGITTLESSATTLEDQIALLDQALSNYEAGDITETDLQQSLDSASAALVDLGSAGEVALDTVADTLSALGITLPTDLEATTPLAYVEQADHYSRFMNDHYGSFDSSGNFTFDPEFDFFNAVFSYAN